MPLAKGKSKKVVSQNIGEMLHKFKATGKIGTTHPGNMKKAQQIAAAAAYGKAGKSRKKQ